MVAIGWVTYSSVDICLALEFVRKEDLVYKMYDSVGALNITGDDLCIVIDVHNTLRDKGIWFRSNFQ